MVPLAHDLATRLPLTRQALAEGVISEYKAQLIAEATRVLGDAAAGEAEAAVVPHGVTGKTPGQIRAAIGRAVLKTDPGAARFACRGACTWPPALPPAVTARHWPLVWAGLDGAIAAGLGTSAWLALRRDRRLRPVTATTATLMATDAWFDVCTSPAGRALAMALMDMTVETGVAVTCLLLPRMARPHAAARLAGGKDDGR